ncbi:phage major capsid protein [Helicobacter cappadocius]|uniref:Phage major capsid protein n=1 Tax=Helicobacter cappadocius TaxID=3063998 RepID=A0AA90Q3Z5_9HELI|nr:MULTISPECIES: phage major capsid protein [unclassified Helicobacter]MDO7253882.1 phage major capsid protein [Helicobacter sp. faydin-H75]MDP2539743.1 phage major capsid protein [Helicobacter sp. faydin-H76]
MNREFKDICFSASMAKESPINDEEMSISFMALSANPIIKREGMFEDYYISIDTDNVRWSAKNLYLDHNPSFNNSIGVIDEVKKDNEGFKVKVKFFEHIPNSKEAFLRYKAGLSNSVSVGFGEANIEEIGKLNNLPHYKIKSGEIVELSAVWLGADKKATITKFAENKNQGEKMDSQVLENKNQGEKMQQTQEKHNDDAKDIAQLAEVLGQKELALKAIAEGKSYAEFRSNLYAKVNENKQVFIQTSKTKQDQEFSLYNVITNKPEGYELEFFDRSSQKFKIPNSFYKKFDANDGGIITKSTNEGVASIEPLYYRGDKFIDLVRSTSPLLSKLDMMSGLVSVQQIPRDNTELDAVFLDEGATSNAQSLSFDHIKLTPKTLSNKVIITRRMFEMTPLALESFVLQKMVTGIRRKLEKVVLYGKNPEPITGIFNTSGVQVVDSFMKNPDFKSALKFKGLLQSADYDTSRCAFFVNAMGFTELEGTPKSINTTNVTTERTLLENNKLAGFDIYVNNLINNGDIILGDFSNSILGVWSDGIEIKTYQEQGDNLIIEGFYDIDFALKRNNAFVISKISK